MARDVKMVKVEETHRRVVRDNGEANHVIPREEFLPTGI